MRIAEIEDRRGFIVERDGGVPVFYAPLIAIDEWRIRRGLEEMSAGTRYLRFFTPATSFSDAQLREMSTPNQTTHVAWVALSPSEPSCPGLGLARMVQDASEPLRSEIAVVVIDRAQQWGVGTHLLACLLASARKRGIKELRASVLPSNTVALEWLCSWGGERRFAGDCWEVSIPVEGAAAARAELCARVAAMVGEIEK